MFRELNAIQYRPKPDPNAQTTMSQEQKSKMAEEDHILKMYSPIIELKKDELASHNQSI